MIIVVCGKIKGYDSNALPVFAVERGREGEGSPPSIRCAHTQSRFTCYHALISSVPVNCTVLLGIIRSRLNLGTGNGIPGKQYYNSMRFLVSKDYVEANKTFAG